MSAFTQKYTSYTSSTNLMSAAFFSNNVSTTTSGEYASLVSAVGKSTSTVQINAVTQLAQAASYTVSTNALGYNGSLEAAGTGIDWNGDYGTSNIAGSSLTLTVGNTKVSVDFGADDKYADENALVAGINAKLAEQDFKGGKADSAIEAKYEGGQIKFGFKDGYNTGGDSLYISGVSGALKNKFGVTSGDLQAGIR